MIHKLHITGVHAEVGSDLHKYVTKKIGRLDRYVPRQARASLHAEVRLKEIKSKDKKHCACEVVLHLPSEKLTVRESTINMFAAVDIVEAKLKNQLKRYKDQHTPRFGRRIAARLLRRQRA